jgi:hypothetical protein
MGEPVAVVGSENFVRVGSTVQILTYNPQTETVTMFQATVAEEVSPALMGGWKDLMDFASGALGATVAASSLGLPTTPAAVLGAAAVYITKKVSASDPDPIPEPLPPDDDPEEEVPEKVE